MARIQKIANWNVRSKKLSLQFTVGGTIMGNVEQENYGISDSREMPDDVLAWAPPVPEVDQDEGAFVDGDESPLTMPSSVETWKEVFDPADFYDESDYVYGGAHFPPTIAI